MDGLFHGKPYEQMDDLGVSHIFGSTHIYIYISLKSTTEQINESLGVVYVLRGWVLSF